MRRIVLLVEGSKDAYFLHELILRRFPSAFVADPRVGAETNTPKMPFVLRAISGAQVFEINWADGYAKIGKLRQSLRRSEEVPDDDEFISGVIFDSDRSTNDVEGSAHAGQRARRLEILRLLGLGEELFAASRKWLYLFPDNREDGDLETVLRGMVRHTDPHMRYFDVAWGPFAKAVEALPANRPTDKSMMNEYKAAFNSGAWDTNGLNRCYADDSLWDWGSKGLDPLVEFFRGLMECGQAENLGGLLR